MYFQLFFGFPLKCSINPVFETLCVKNVPKGGTVEHFSRFFCIFTTNNGFF